MSIITYPTNTRIAVAEPVDWGLDRRSSQLRSPFTGKRQVLAQAYALWVAKGHFARIDDLTAAGILRSFLVKLEGQVNTFRFPVPGYGGPSTGYAGAAGLVNGASQTGQSLITDGWTNSAAIFLEGDYFTVNDELKMLTANATANGSGQVTLAFKPALRASPADNAALTITAPTVLMSSNIDYAAKFTINAPLVHSVEFDFMEAF